MTSTAALATKTSVAVAKLWLDFTQTSSPGIATTFFFSNFNCIPFGQGLTLSETITNELSNDLIYLPYFRILWGSSLKIGEVIEEKEIETLRCRHFVGKSRGPWCVRYQESGNQSNDVTFTCCTYRSLWDSSNAALFWYGNPLSFFCPWSRKKSSSSTEHIKILLSVCNYWVSAYMDRNPSPKKLQGAKLTLSFPRVINFEFLPQPHQKYYIGQYGELSFS